MNCSETCCFCFEYYENNKNIAIRFNPIPIRLHWFLDNGIYLKNGIKKKNFQYKSVILTLIETFFILILEQKFLQIKKLK